MPKRDKPKRGRPPKVIPGIPNTFEDVVKTLVEPVKQEQKRETERVG